MKTISELNSKWYWRLAKILWFIIIILVGADDDWIRIGSALLLLLVGTPIIRSILFYIILGKFNPEK